MIENATFYNFIWSSASYRVRIAFELKGVAPREVVQINLREAEHRSESYLKVAPCGLVPALDFGGVSFSQSLAMLEWLDTEYPQNPLIPADPMEAMAAREIAYAVACDIHPINNPRIQKYLTGVLHVSEEERAAWYDHWVRVGFDGVEALLRRHERKGPYALGDTVSIADVCLVPQVFNARRFNVDLTGYPRLRAVDAACNDLPAFVRSRPRET